MEMEVTFVDAIVKSFHIVFIFCTTYVIYYWIVATSNDISYLWQMVRTRAAVDATLDITEGSHATCRVMGKPHKTTHRSSTTHTCQH
jgi:hypothetical protein